MGLMVKLWLTLPTGRPGEYAVSPGFFQVNLQIHLV